MSSESKTLTLAPESRRSLFSRLRPLILAGVVSAIVMEIVALSPASIEEAHDKTAPVDPEILLPREKVTLAPGIPATQVPEYSINQFNYVSTHESVKEWNLLAKTAYFYNSARMVHARTVKAFLFDPDGKITVVTGEEAKYSLAPEKATPQAKAPTSGGEKADAVSTRDLEVYGNVHTVFPDGFEVQSEYMHYRPDIRSIEIPVTYAAAGRGKDERGQVLSFKSMGMIYSRKSEIINLPAQVRVTIEGPESKPKPAVPASQAGPTHIDSDHCQIDRAVKMAYFTMYPTRAIADRFVRITQPTTFSKGRRGELNYGDSTAASTQLLHKMALFDDVLVRETGKGEIRYATSGQANFDAAQDIVVLTKFPQVYENEDTVTGDKIVLHRDTDIVEVEHSNSFTMGASMDEIAPKDDK